MNAEKVTLVICDGMGLSAEVKGNAIVNAQTPTFDYLFSRYPAMRLLAAGTEVGLDMGEPGNSEVGHLSLGTGQVLPQAFQIINAAIKSESYRTNKVFLEAFERVKQSPERTLHLVGLVSGGGVHGHIGHLAALLELAHQKGVKRVAVHAITDGRDSPPRVAQKDIDEQITPLLKKFEFGVLASIGGRYYAMDRDHNWERTDVFYWTILGKGTATAVTYETAVKEGYSHGESDENLQPTLIVNQEGQPVAPLLADDVVLFTNYRPDRIRQLVERMLTTPLPMTVVMMTNYFLEDIPVTKSKIRILNAYPLSQPTGTLAQTLARGHKKQLHIGETEKYAHITYFFNGHEEKKEPEEQWLLIPSAKVDSFDRIPGMSAAAITQAYLQSRPSGYDFTTINYANMDMVAHTGNYEATVKAVVSVDNELQALVKTCETTGEWLLITADHGNAEQMINPTTGEPDKEHTVNPVPFIAVHPSLKKARLMDKQRLADMANTGILADVAPTILEILSLRKPAEMVGSSLVTQLKLI